MRQGFTGSTTGCSSRPTEAILGAKSQPQLVDKVDAAGTVKLAVRIRYASLRRGRSYRVVVVATAADGQRSRLVIPFRR